MPHLTVERWACDANFWSLSFSCVTWGNVASISHSYGALSLDTARERTAGTGPRVSVRPRPAVTALLLQKGAPWFSDGKLSPGVWFLLTHLSLGATCVMVCVVFSPSRVRADRAWEPWSRGVMLTSVFVLCAHILVSYLFLLPRPSYQILN